MFGKSPPKFIGLRNRSANAKPLKDIKVPTKLIIANLRKNLAK